MADLRPSPRLLLGVAALLLAAAEAASLVETLEAQARARDRRMDVARAQISRVRPALEIEARSGPEAACRRAVAAGLGEEAEAFDANWKTLAAEPRPAPVEHRPAAGAIERAPDRLLVAGPTGEDGGRILAYLPLAGPAGGFVLRIAARDPGPALDAHDRRAQLVAHGAVLLLVLVAGALLLFPARDSSSAGAGEGALIAYEQAMDRLRSRGEELTRLHAEERHRMEGELQELEAMARAGELTAGIVHEVRNGLGTVMGYARLLERSSSAEDREAGAGIREECETLETVVRRFMDYVRRDQLDLASFDLAKLIGRVVARESRARPGEVKLSTEKSCELEGDEGLLERAFENLVRNALQAAGSGGQVELSLTGAGDEVVVSLIDDGPGLSIDPAEALRPFRSTRPGGLGLGLPTAHKLIRLHGGRLELESRPQAGTRVTVRLPRRQPASSSA